MGAPIGNRNAAGNRRGATRRMINAIRKGRRKSIMDKLKGKKSKYANTPGGRSARLYDLARRLNRRKK